MAATDLERLVVQLSADITKYERALSRANSETNKRFAAIERRAVSMNSKLASSFTSLGARLGVALAAAFSVKGLADLQDAYTKIQNALKVAGLSGKELTGIYNQLYAAAQKNAAPIESLAVLYSRVAINQRELGVSSSQIVGLVENVAKSLKVQGSSAEEAQGALLQLSQALGSGKVQAEEYNSLIDGLPVLLQAAAAGIKQAGGSVSKLTQLVKSGQISNKALFDGIAAGASTIEDKLKGSSETSGQAILALRNALINAAGKFDEATGSSEKFSSAVGSVVAYLDGVSFDNLVTAINNVIAALDTGIAKFSEFLQKAGELGGLNSDALNRLGYGGPPITRGDDGYDYLYGGGKQERDAQAAAEKRLDIEKQIADIKELQKNIGDNDLARSGLRDQLVILEGMRDAALDVKQSLENPAKKPMQGPLNFQGPVKPTAPVDPIDITDTKYKPTSSNTGGSKAKKARLDEYEREIKQVRDRTAAINAQTDAQAELNPYVNDYGYNVERASTAQDLLTAAQNAGTAAGKELKDVQQLLSGNFDGLSPKAREQAEAMLLLANNAAQASARSQELADTQDRLRETMEEWRDVSKDATKGFIKDILEGKSALEALGGALQKIGDKLLDGALEGLFGASGSNNWFSSLFSGFSSGGPVKAATGGQIRGPGTGTSDSIPAMLSDGEFVVNAAATKRNRNLLEAINNGKAMHLASGGGVNLPRLPRAESAGGMSVTYAPVIDARGADSAAVARLEQALAKDRAEFQANVIKTVNKGNRRRLLN